MNKDDFFDRNLKTLGFMSFIWGSLMFVIAPIMSLAMFCGSIYFVFWCLQHFHIIG